MHTVDANGDLTQQYRSNSDRRPLHGARHASSSATRRSIYGERLNHDLGIYAQDSWTMKRLTINAGIRWEALNAQVLAGESPAGRFVPGAHTSSRDQGPAELEGLGAAVRGRLRPVRQRQDRAQVLAEPLQPGAHDRHRRQLQPAAVADARRCRGGTSNGDDIAQGERGCDGATRRRRLRDQLRQPVRRTSASPR